MSELKQTKTALIVTAILTLLLLMGLATKLVPNVGNLQALVFLLFCIGLFMTLGLAIKYIAEIINERW